LGFVGKKPEHIMIYQRYTHETYQFVGYLKKKTFSEFQRNRQVKRLEDRLGELLKVTTGFLKWAMW
jgi:hypothetical protein